MKKRNLIFMFVIFFTMFFCCKIEVNAVEYIRKPDGVRYDINKFYLKTEGGKEKISLAGWAVYKEYGGNLVNTGKKGEYAPVFHFRFYDITDGNTRNSYDYTASIDTGFSVTCALYDRPSGGTSCTNDNRFSLPGIYHHDNVDFVIDNWEVEFEEGHSYVFQMKIDVPESANGYAITSEWFDVKIVEIPHDTSGAHEIDINSTTAYDYVYQTTDTVDFIATNAYKQSADIEYGVAHANGRGIFSTGSTYTIHSFKVDDAYGSQPVKYVYFELEPGSWAYSTWVQFSGDSFTITKLLDCTNPITPAQKKMCCESDASYANNNLSYCCDTTNSNLSNTTSGLDMCCNSGEYAYNNPGYCCSRYPETCCDANESKLDGTDWFGNLVSAGNISAITNLWNTYYGPSTVGRYVCCSANPYTSSSTFAPGVELPTFYKRNFPSLTGLCVSTPSSIAKKACNISLDGEKTENNTKTIAAINAGETIEENITFSGDISDLDGTITDDNIAYEFFGIDPSNFKLEVTDLSVSNTGLHYDVELKIKITNVSSARTSEFNLTTKLTICYKKSSSPAPNCSNSTYFNSHKGECCALNPDDPRCPSLRTSLTCNSSTNKVVNDQEVYTTSTGDLNINCSEDITYETKDIEHFKDNIIYSGTGFSYDIDVKDTVTCRISKKRTTLSNTITESNVRSILNNAFNNLKKLPGSNTHTYINSDESSLGKVEYILDGGVTEVSSVERNGLIDYRLSSDPLYRRTYNGIVTITKTWEYKLTLPKQYISKKDYSLTIEDKSGDDNYIDGGNKYYTDINQETNFNDFTITIEDGGISQKADMNSFTCQYLTENILTSGSDGIGFTSDKKRLNYDVGEKYITRPISLAAPFNSSDRLEDATNWSKNNNDRRIEDVITDNTMYSFTLTPANISNIQDYNDAQGKYSTWNFDNYNIYSAINYNSRTSKFLNCLKNGCSSEGIDKLDTISLPDDDYREEKHGDF